MKRIAWIVSLTFVCMLVRPQAALAVNATLQNGEKLETRTTVWVRINVDGTMSISSKSAVQKAIDANGNVKWTKDVSNLQVVTTNATVSAADFSCSRTGSTEYLTAYHVITDELDLPGVKHQEFKAYPFRRDHARLVNFGGGNEWSTQFHSCIVGGVTPAQNWRARLAGVSGSHLGMQGAATPDSTIDLKGARGQDETNYSWSLGFQVQANQVQLNGSIDLGGEGANDYAYGGNPRMPVWQWALPNNEWWADWHVGCGILDTIWCGSPEVERAGANALFEFPPWDSWQADPIYFPFIAYSRVSCANPAGLNCVIPYEIP